MAAMAASSGSARCRRNSGSDIAPETLTVQILVPDTAAAGTNTLRLGVALAGAAGNDSIGARSVEVTAAAVGVGESDAPAFVLVGIRPNPVVETMAVAFALPEAGPATLELFDVHGRRVAVRREMDLSAGAHLVPMESRGKLPSGVYVVRLTFGGRSLQARAVVRR